ARCPSRRANMLPMSSTVTVQPRVIVLALNQSRTVRSRSVNVSRQMPPFGVTPILAVSIKSSHSRSGSIVRFFISDRRLAGLRFGQLRAPVTALENERHARKQKQSDA